MSSLAVKFSGVYKYFDQITAVDNLDIEIPKGCIYGYLGPNGAGKTSSIRMITGILKPDAGSVCVLGNTNPSKIKNRLGYLPEEKGLYKKMRILDLVIYFARLKKMSRQDARLKALQLLEQFELSDRANNKCESLSKGLGQKLQIIATLIHQPELVVLDEPFSGLDPVNVELVRNTILSLKQNNHTVIFSTHVMEQAEQICDSLLLINKGKKLLSGTLPEIRSGMDHNLIVDYDGDGSILHTLPGIERVRDAGKHAELTLKPGTSAQDILKLLVDKLTIRRFDTRETSLHNIFIQAVKGANSNV
ncbi:MAG: ATP-binding cassette domain-containing protein [Pseudomonadales bacterium]|nr:ATP-binding cassette domain-containing protein [Pseudomonadales bacterium]